MPKPVSAETLREMELHLDAVIAFADQHDNFLLGALLEDARNALINNDDAPPRDTA